MERQRLVNKKVDYNIACVMLSDVELKYTSILIHTHMFIYAHTDDIHKNICKHIHALCFIFIMDLCFLTFYKTFFCNNYMN